MIFLISFKLPKHTSFFASRTIETWQTRGKYLEVFTFQLEQHFFTQKKCSNLQQISPIATILTGLSYHVVCNEYLWESIVQDAMCKSNLPSNVGITWRNPCQLTAKFVRIFEKCVYYHTSVLERTKANNFPKETSSFPFGINSANLKAYVVLESLTYLQIDYTLL